MRPSSLLSPILRLIFLIEHPIFRHDVVLQLRHAGDLVSAHLIERRPPRAPASLVEIAWDRSPSPSGSSLADLLILLALFYARRRPPILPDRVFTARRPHPLEIFLAHSSSIREDEIWWSPN